MGPEARDAVPALQQAMQRTFKMSLLSRAMALALLRIEGHAPATVES
jgi:hypothetical protein